MEIVNGVVDEPKGPTRKTKISPSIKYVVVIEAYKRWKWDEKDTKHIHIDEVVEGDHSVVDLALDWRKTRINRCNRTKKRRNIHRPKRNSSTRTTF